jgi:hypothetical protein
MKRRSKIERTWLPPRRRRDRRASWAARCSPRFDKDAGGRISATELRLFMEAALGEDVTAEDAEALAGAAVRAPRGEGGVVQGGSRRRSACTRRRRRRRRRRRAS